MFIVALFTTSKTLKQPKCPSTDEWIKKMWYIQYIYAHTHKYNGILYIIYSRILYIIYLME